ncbi:MAG TPA: NAD(P)-dependent alcohol dehydrogenase [Polyangiaceae bacterium]|nr:NAD(P)-dependent alcohol dehydrogenase [Polyangiaceae bacterium]
MKAITYDRYGSPAVLRMQEVPKPAPADDEILIRTRATTVTTGDWRVRSMDVPTGFGLLSRLIFGLTKPRQPILGTELAGEIEAVGPGVTRFKTGDRVFAFDGARMGCHAEYKCMPESGSIAPMPKNMTFEEAAALSFGGTAALHFLRAAGLKRGERVLINGASGCVGSATVQIAKHFDAHVTGVCSTHNLQLVRSLGADRVIDYTREDFTQNGETFDVIVDTAGTSPFSRCSISLNDNGRLLIVLGKLPDMLQIPWISLTTNKKVIAGPATERPEDLASLPNELLAN